MQRVEKDEDEKNDEQHRSEGSRVSRLLRAGGLFAFNIATPFLDVCWQSSGGPGERLLHDYFGMHRFEDEADRSVSFQLPYGEWIRLFRRTGFTIEDLIEIRPPEGATSTYQSYADPAWARRFPSENIWKVRKEPRRA